MSQKSIALFCREGASDKVYQLQLEQSADFQGWVVNFQNGRRGSALKSGTKTSSPQPYEVALKLYDKVVREKMSGGYTPDTSGIAYTSTHLAERDGGMRPMLPLPVAQDVMQRLLEDPCWGIQPKMDGENRMLRSESGVVVGANRKGLLVPIPEAWATNFRAMGDFEMAGEAVGETFYAFDLLSEEGRDLRKEPFERRHQKLCLLTMSMPAEALRGLRIVPLATTPSEKLQMLEDIVQSNGEGIVLKLLAANHQDGKNANSLKYKLQESSTFIVTQVNSQRSVRLGLLPPDAPPESAASVDMGNVTIPANATVPAVGDLVEVRYLYRFENGALEQPVYLGPRNDIDRADCHEGQIARVKKKSDEPAEAPEGCDEAPQEAPSFS